MTGWGPEDVVALRRALDKPDQAAVRRLSRTFVTHVHDGPRPVPAVTATAVLRMLQADRQIALVQDVAEALLAHGHDTVGVRHRYALALVDAGRTTAAEAVLAQLPDDVRRTDTEVQGAVGRVHKQRYVDSGPAAGAGRERDLAAAVAAYAAAYEAQPVANYYHGVNAAALLMRAAGDGLALPGHPDPAADAKRIATAVLAGIEAAAEPDLWQLATAAEACLVRGDHDVAVEWLAHYAGADGGAFAYGSTLRQFQQLWRLDTHREPGLRLIPMLRYRLLQTAGGSLSVAPDELTPESLSRFERVEETLRERGHDTHYERVFGWDRFKPLEWLRQALVTCRSVARVQDAWGNGCGTGFVLAGDEIRPGWPHRVLLTNAHVVPDTVAADDAVVAFHGLADQGADAVATVRHLGPILWTSAKHELDACFLPLPDSLSADVVPLRVRPRFPTLTGRNEVRAYVVGHPLGSPELQLSLHDTRLLAPVGEVYAHYRSPTETGSSGSPVFDDTWRVMALHHGWTDGVPGIAGPEGAGGSPANEGIRLDRLLAALGPESAGT